MEQWARLTSGAQNMFLFKTCTTSERTAISLTSGQTSVHHSDHTSVASNDTDLVQIEPEGDDWFSDAIFVLEGHFSVASDRTALVDTILALWTVMIMIDVGGTAERLRALINEQRCADRTSNSLPAPCHSLAVMS